jgi:predicted Zn-dependent protease
VALAPDQSQYVYVYAVGLNSFGRTQDAIRTLERAAQRWPRQRDVQLALATMYRDAGRRDAARNVAKRYADAFPDDTEVQALVRSLN